MPDHNPADAPEFIAEVARLGLRETDMMDAEVGGSRVVHVFLWGGLDGWLAFEFFGDQVIEIYEIF